LNPQQSTSDLVEYMLARPDMLRELTKFRCAMMTYLRSETLFEYEDDVIHAVRGRLEKEKNYISRCNSE